MIGRVIETLLGGGGTVIPELPRQRWQQDTVVGNGGLHRFARNLPADLDEPVGWQLRGRTGADAPMHEVPVTGFPFSIGRRCENALVLTDPTVSGRHAEVMHRGPILVVRDLGSTNGTFVNGRRITGFESLRSGDVLQFGSVRYTLGQRRDALTKATVTVDVAEEALGHLLFERLISVPAVLAHYQPIVRLADGRRTGFEILARSDLPGLETPGAMFRIAAECGREAELSQTVRREGLKGAQVLGRFADLYLNTHPAELNRPDLIRSIERLRQEFPERRIVLEVHEAAVTSTKALAELRARLTALNVRLAYDDFGAGQSRLMELAEAPPHVLKFDMHLIRDLATASPERRKLVGSLVEVVRGLKVVPLAEGIETSDEASACFDLGFELGQGYYFGRPAAADEWRR